MLKHRHESMTPIFALYRSGKIWLRPLVIFSFFLCLGAVYFSQSSGILPNVFVSISICNLSGYSGRHRAQNQGAWHLKVSRTELRVLWGAVNQCSEHWRTKEININTQTFAHIKHINMCLSNLYNQTPMTNQKKLLAHILYF